MIRAGRMDRRIELQRATETRDAEAGVVRTWSTYATLPAAVTPVSGSEGLKNQLPQASRTAIFLIRYRPGVLVTDRILFGGVPWDITFIAEQGRREALELTATATT